MTAIRITLSSFIPEGPDRIGRGGFHGLDTDGQPGDDARETGRKNEPSQLSGELDPVGEALEPTIHVRCSAAWAASLKRPSNRGRSPPGAGFKC
jgi:hypothetical protein